MAIGLKLRQWSRGLSWLTVAVAAVIIAAVIVVFVLAFVKKTVPMSVSGVGISLTIFISATIIASLHLWQLRLLCGERRRVM